MSTHPEMPMPHIERDEFYGIFRVYFLGREIGRGPDIKELRREFPGATGWGAT